MFSLLFFVFRIQLEKVCGAIVYRDDRGDYRRGRTKIRPVDGLNRSTVDWSIDVSFPTIVLC